MHTPPAAVLESHRILTRDLERAAAVGELRPAPGPAAQMVMAANAGVALMLVARPATFGDASVSRRVRGAVHAAVVTPDVSGASDDADGAGAAVSEAHVPSTAARLSALLRQSPDPALSAAEGALLTEWLNRLSNAPRDR